jgi:hypothetical protein
VRPWLPVAKQLAALTGGEFHRFFNLDGYNATSGERERAAIGEFVHGVRRREVWR